MEIEICQLCKKILEENEISRLAFLLRFKELEYTHNDEIDPSLEKKGFIITHETLEHDFVKIKVYHTFIETHTHKDGGGFNTKEKECQYICCDYNYHTHLLSK
jgi:hypothetical protein